MTDPIPLKLLFQHKETAGPDDKWRLTVLIDAETIRDLLVQLENKPGMPVFASAEMPNEHMEIHVEIFEQGRPLSGLLYSKHLTENGWTTNHITLVKG